MIERDVSAIMRGVTPVLREHFGALSARLIKEVETAETIRSAEHKAFMAECGRSEDRRERAFTDALREMQDRLAKVKDGADGAPGRDGIDGAQGTEGSIGPAGADGRDGIDGKDGEPGPQGPPGEPGVQGDVGPEGPIGPKGDPGDKGDTGDEGPSGPQGEPGRDGTDGEAGPQGENGDTGEPGAVGPAGNDGRDGIDGKDGADAYHGEARGLFDPTATYRALDVVSFNGSEWRAKHDDPGELPGAGWMLSASRGKRGDKGDRGERGLAGSPAPTVAAHYIDAATLQHVITLSDGTELKADLMPLAQIIRGAQG